MNEPELTEEELLFIANELTMVKKFDIDFMTRKGNKLREEIRKKFLQRMIMIDVVVNKISEMAKA